MAISDTKLRSLYGKPYSGPTEMTDADGLSVRVSPRGVINFQYRYRWGGKQHRLGIGKYPAISLREARNVVAELKESLDRGLNPRHAERFAKAKSRPTVRDCLSYWRETYVDVNLRPRTKALYYATVLKHLSGAFEGIPQDEIPIRGWVDFFTAQERANPVRARQLLTQFRAAMGWCIRRQFIDNSSVMKLAPKDVGRKPEVGEVTLSYSQLAKIWLAIERSRASTANKLLHQLLMLYGARNTEMRCAVYSEFDLEEEVWLLPASRSKTNKIIRRPIFAQVSPLLEKLHTAYGEIIFPGTDLKKSMTIAGANRYLKRIQKDLGICDFTAHDFRRTLATRLSEEGVAPHVVEKMLGHDLGGVLAVYNKHDWIDEQRDAYELYASRIFEHIRKISD
ncbi:Integrase [Izhakiella capsodis]|uniref:Integrase n=1 Tax=Izhakiella capsodis TaxID=1367852 RepID=A0A1I5BV79_9GAMM|nr:site-specific integrase [Izhakiella capsodis]SFN78600.1 Integrase [Izhakiella capsodis]